MKNPEHLFTVFEEYPLHTTVPKRLFFGRCLSESKGKAVVKYNLKKRTYIATTSMDAELSLITANIALCRPGSLAYDPFMGTGSFPLAAAHFGSTVFGSDLDGRSIRGKKGRNVAANFIQYGTSAQYLGGFAADLTNTPLKQGRFLDAILCDPPYGVREGLKVLGSTKDYLQREVVLKNGMLAHLKEDYIPPRKAYSFVRMLDDILDFSANMLVNDGRLSMWIPVAGAVEGDLDHENENEGEVKDEENVQEYVIPQHPALVLVSQCRQDFNKCTYKDFPLFPPVASCDRYVFERIMMKANEFFFPHKGHDVYSHIEDFTTTKSTLTSWLHTRCEDYKFTRKVAQAPLMI